MMSAPPNTVTNVRAGPGRHSLVAVLLLNVSCATEESDCHCTQCEIVDGAAFARGEIPEGELCVVGDLDVRDKMLGVLPRVREVTGAMKVEGTVAGSIDLGSLRRVGTAFAVHGNSKLEHVGPISLDYVGGGVHFFENPSLTSLDLEVASGSSFFVALNPSLGSLRLAAETQRSITIEHNESLTSVDLGQVRDIQGNLSLRDNGVLSFIDVSSLAHIAGDFQVERNDALTSLHLAEGLQDIGGALTVQNNPGLEELSLGGELLGLDGATIRRNSKLRLIEAGPGVSLSESSHLLVQDNSSLRSIVGFESVVALGVLWISGNQDLVDWKGFGALEQIGPGPIGLLFADNRAFSGAEAEFLPSLSQASALSIFGNFSLAEALLSDLIERVNSPRVKVGDNGGAWTPLDPCPWLKDFFCDEKSVEGTNLCVSDPEDCT